MSIQTRFITDRAEIDAAFRVFLRAMVGLPLRDVDTAAVTEPGRYLGALEDGVVVAGTDSYTSWLTVPGGARVPHAAVTHVGVLPTHRRRGIVRRLLTEQLHDAADRGEVVASLRASEAVIYERFGYCVATSSQPARVTLRRAALRPELPEDGEVRILDADATPELLAEIYDGARWTGAIARPPAWWRFHALFDAASTAPRYVAVHRTDGVDDGYVAYRPEDTDHWFGSAERTVTVTDLVATNDGARAGLWRHLLDLDLVDVVAFEQLPLDDPLPLALVDRRAVTLGSAHDETWLRLVDVEAALQARSYGGDDPVALRVLDPLLPANEATYEVGPKTVARTEASPEVVVDVATLAAAYLGGTTWNRLAAAGRVEVRVPAALARLDALFGVDRLPFAGTSF